MATKKPAQNIIVGGSTITVPAQTQPKKKTTQQLIDEVLNQAAAIQNQGKAAVTETKASAQQVNAAVAGAQNAIQGFAAATGSGNPPREGTTPSIPFAGGMRPAGPGDQQPVVGITAPEYLPDSLKETPITAERRDAFKLIEDEFTKYGLQELIPEIRKYMVGFTDEKGNRVMVGPNEASIMLEQTQAFQKRFAGNAQRLKKGLNVLSPGDYLKAEDEYSQLFKQFGQTGFATKEEYANLIGGDISGTELNKRLQLARDAWDYGDPQVKAALKLFYPGITDADAIGYFLKPEMKLPELQQKVASAEIGGEALRQGLTATAASAEEYAKAGVDLGTARTGYQNVAAVLPTTTKLAGIYGEENIPYTQRTAEEEFLLQSQSAAEKRKRLASLERAKFSGDSGINPNISTFATKGSRGAF